MAPFSYFFHLIFQPSFFFYTPFEFFLSHLGTIFSALLFAPIFWSFYIYLIMHSISDTAFPSPGTCLYIYMDTLLDPFLPDPSHFFHPFFSFVTSILNPIRLKR